jgi:hypothetical protein
MTTFGLRPLKRDDVVNRADTHDGDEFHLGFPIPPKRLGSEIAGDGFDLEAGSPCVVRTWA